MSLRGATLFGALALMACAPVDGDPGAPPGIVSGTPIMVDGMELLADQKQDWPLMIAPADATGQMTPVQSGTGATVVISGSPDSRDRAIRALAGFCGRAIDPDGFDTQFVFQDPATGDWWFDGFCG